MFVNELGYKYLGFVQLCILLNHTIYFFTSYVNRIKHTYILDDPFDDPPQITEFIPEASPEGKPKDEVMAS